MATLTYDKFEFPDAFKGAGTETGDNDYVLTPSRTGWAKLNYQITNGTGTLTVSENGNAFDDWSGITASQAKLIYVNENVPITFSFTSTSTLEPKIITDL
jgi:hypothetical protein